MVDVDWNLQLAEQPDWHWRENLRPRLDGMTDAEYRWEPVAGAWNVRPRGTGTAPLEVGAGEFTLDYAVPAPVPPPVTTIAWRLGHITVGVLGLRVAAHFGGPASDYDTHRYPGDAAGPPCRWPGSCCTSTGRCRTTGQRSRCCATSASGVSTDKAAVPLPGGKNRR
jgi:DinB superfamily